METATSVNEPRITGSKRNSENTKANPNFIIIGGQKCSTTWLFKLLSQHPQIFIPESKELNFYNKRFNYVKGIEWYRNQFKDYSGEKAVGECTPNYLWTSNDPEDLKESDRTENIPEQLNES